MSTNRLRIVDREMISGSLEGVDFGPELYCVARSPSAVLVWEQGHSWSVNGHVSYAESHFTVIPDRSASQRFRMRYQRIGNAGGRLSAARMAEVVDSVMLLFGSGPADIDLRDAMIAAVRQRKTLLIEGGGPPLPPSRKLGAAAYQSWRELPYKGLINTTL